LSEVTLLRGGQQGMIKRIYNRPGSRGHRNPENNPADHNDGGELDSSGRKVRETHPTEKAPKKFESRGQLERTGAKRPRSQSETRDSSREPARGRAEFTGRLNKRVNDSGGNVRTTTTAAKSDRGATSPTSRSRTASQGR
jgi:hypothetical protein